MKKVLKFCAHPGCSALTSERYCEQHKDDERELRKQQDFRRGSSRARGYTARWDRYSKWFLSLPQNQFCALHMDDRCAGIAQCVDHIDPPDGPDDPRFWDMDNHQPACIHCNSVKGHRYITGQHIYGNVKAPVRKQSYWDDGK